MLDTTAIRGSSIELRPYRFPSMEAKERFCNAASRPSGSIVLYELARIAEGCGLDIPKNVEARSKFRPEMLVKPLTTYLEGGKMGNYDGTLLNQAFERVKRAFFVGKLKAVALERCNWQPTKNAGAPSFDKKANVYRESLGEAKAIRKGMCPPPLAVFHRGKSEEVVRPVFAYPFSMTLLETRFFEPFQYEVMNHHNPYIGGRSYSVLSGDIYEMRWKSDWIMEMDYSGFDGSISSTLITLAFKVIENNFVFDDVDRSDWELVKRYFLTAPWLLPDGQLLVGRRHGVPSGSMFTQIVDSIVNAIAIEYTKLRVGFRTSRYYVLGDDSLIGIIGRKPDFSEIDRSLSELGIRLNVKKSSVSPARQPAHYFLGHYWWKGYGTRDLQETWEKVLTPERPQRELFSKDRLVRFKAFIERLKAYQDDNPDAFEQLQQVIEKLQNPGIASNRYRHDSTWLKFVSNAPYQERLSWDLALAHLRSGGESVRHRRWSYQVN